MTLQEGKCVIFDDSFLHEAANLSDKPRVVLIVDVWHPDLTSVEVIFHVILISKTTLTKINEEQI